MIKEEKLKEIKANNITNELTENTNNNINNINNNNYNKNLVLFKKVNINNKIKKNDENEIINKTNTGYSMKIKNLFSLKFNRSNDVSLGLGIKKLDTKKKNIIKSKKKISCDENETCSTILNKIEINKKRNQTIYNKREKYRDFSIEKANDEQSCAFQNLVNLNKIEKGNVSPHNIKDDNNKSFNIQLKKSFLKKRVEKSPERIKFFLTEAKNYFHEDDKYKKNHNKSLQTKIISNEFENNINKNKNREKINFNFINENFKEINEDDENNIYHKTIQYNQKKNEKNLLEYDGDMETVTTRNKSLSKNKSKNKKNKNIENINQYNKNNVMITNLTNIKKEKEENIEVIEPKNIKLNINYYKTFCQGFFVSGIPNQINENSIISESTNYLPPCGHKFCSLLYSISPEILYFYKNDNLEVSDDLLKNISNSAFPLGIKICIENSFFSKNIIQIPQQTFFNMIKNNTGEKLYTCTSYYFIKIKNDEFKKKYNFDISSFFSEKQNNNNFQKYILTISRLLNGHSFYVPQSITLVSKEPFLNSMFICANGFVPTIFEERINLINHIINEVPSPGNFNIGIQIKFYIPIYSSPIILNNQINIFKAMLIKKDEEEKEIFENNYLSRQQLNYKILLDILPIEHIVFIFSMILLEQKILFVYNSYIALSQIIFIFLSFIYPFSTDDIDIFPVLSLKTLNLVENSKNFIAGMDEYLFSYTEKNNNNIFNMANNNIIIYNISQKCFISIKNRKKVNRKDLMNEYKLFPLPDKISNFITKELKNIFKNIKLNQDLFKDQNNIDLKFYNKYCNFLQNLEINIKLIFIKSLIMLIGDYNNYTFFIEEEKTLFNREAFIESYKEKDFKNYLNQIIKTDFFKNFLEKQRQIYIYEKKKINEKEEDNEIKNNNLIFFSKFLSKYPELINNQQLRKNSNINKINPDIESKIKLICSKLTLINNSNQKENDENNNQNQNIKINKRKTNVLFSGKNYLEDNPEDNIKQYSENPLGEYKSYYTHAIKESKISTEATTINAYFNILNKNDIIENNNEKQKILYIDINKKRKVSSDEKNNKSKEFIKKYLLLPYFLCCKGDDEDYIKEKNTEDTIKKEIEIYRRKKNIKERIQFFLTQVTTLSKYIDFNSYNITKNKIYIIMNNNYIKENSKNNNLKDNDNFKSEVKIFKKKYFKEEISEKDIIKLDNIYGAEEGIVLINKCFKSCFINKPELNNDHLILLKKLFLNIENREYFANLIIPEIFILNRDKICFKQLTSSSFNTFSKIMKLSFENLDSEDNNLGRLLTLACFIYYKIEKEKMVFLYTNFTLNKSNNSQKNSQPYNLWSLESFWIEFFNSEFEINNKVKEEDRIYKIEKYEDEDKKEEVAEDYRKKICLIKTVIGVTNIMSRLNLEKNFIINIIEKMVLPVFINDFYYINVIMKLAFAANNVN